MGSVLGSVCMLCLLGGPAGADTIHSYLYQPAYSVDSELRWPAEPYLPQPGDIVLTSDWSLFWGITFSLALTGAPHHACIVIALPDGQLAMLEAGPHDQPYVGVMDLLPNLHLYEQEGRIWVRRRRTPLTAQQSAKLTAFALAQEGKPFAVYRLALQITPFRNRGPLRTWLLGHSQGERESYFCSELVMESLVVTGLIDAATARPSATFPRDIFFDHSSDPYLNTHLNLSADWFPPARWSSTPEAKRP